MITRLAFLFVLAAGLAGSPVSAEPMARIDGYLNQAAGTDVDQTTTGSVPAFHLPKLFTLRPAPRRTALYCMTIALYHEARGEPITGQLAVARVILNRVRSRAYPDSVCDVVFQNEDRHNRCQFSFACDGRSDAPRNVLSYAKLLGLSYAVLHDSLTDCLRPTDPREFKSANYDQVTHYHTASVAPEWGRKIGRVGQIGHHIFYRSERVARTL